MIRCMLINYDIWIPCFPFLSLTAATLLFALFGIIIGLSIALSPPQTMMVETTETFTLNMTESEWRNSTTNINTIENMKIINGEMVIYYTQTRDITKKVPYSHLSEAAHAIIEFPGKLWLSALKLSVLPLISLMMIVLPSRVENVGTNGKIAMIFYLFTSICAAVQGTIWAYVIEPGKVGKTRVSFNESLETSSKDGLTVTDAIFNVFYNAIPDNIISAMSDLMILGVIVFFLMLGILLRQPNVKEHERNAVLHASHAILRCCMMAIVWIIWCAPIGMLSLIALKIAATDDLLNLMSALGVYLLCIIVGLFVHTFVFYPLLFWTTTRLNPYKFYCQIVGAPLMAFATSSSAATLPRSLQVAKAAGIRKEIYSFILPLGSAINMDGTALQFPIMIALIAQLNGVSLDFSKIMVVMILSTVVSIGTAPIPNAGMVYLTMLFESAGIGYLAGEGIATLFVLDWLADRLATAMNVTSDQFVAKIVDVIDERRTARMHDTDKHSRCRCCFVSNKEFQLQTEMRSDKR